MANEKRLIDANALVEDLEAAKANNGMGALVASTLIRYVKRCTTVDAVEVVRCKDCHYYDAPEDGDALGYCRNGRLAASYASEIYPEPDYFCAYGERKSSP